MKILVLNSGSSSIKFQLFRMPAGETLCTGLVERVGSQDAQLHYKAGGSEFSESLNIPDHETGLAAAAEWLMDEDRGVLTSTDEIEVVGHRIVHGGSSFSRTSEITEAVKAEIKKLSSLAPLHNPANLAGVEVAEQIFTAARQIAVFDTAFHQTIPEKAHRYAIPEHLYTDEHIRLYGFHGTSHKYVSEKARDFLGTDVSKMITLHLGNGCSATAIQDGKSVDHSLGFSPMTGLLMGTRAGDIDPSLIFYLVEQLDYPLHDVEAMLQKESGLLGLTGLSDLRDIDTKARAGDAACQLALDMMTYRIRKYIGAYAAAMNGLDAVVFTGGIGENSITVRQMVCSELGVLGIELDPQLNAVRSDEIVEVNTPASRVKILVIPTNEELEIAKQCFEVGR